LTLLAKRYGKIKKNGIFDLQKAAHMVINDWTRYYGLFLVKALFFLYLTLIVLKSGKINE
jgi:hypothetical protein